jgi:hypothetical protein
MKATRRSPLARHRRGLLTRRRIEHPSTSTVTVLLVTPGCHTCDVSHLRDCRCARRHRPRRCSTPAMRALRRSASQERPVPETRGRAERVAANTRRRVGNVEAWKSMSCSRPPKPIKRVDTAEKSVNKVRLPVRWRDRSHTASHAWRPSAVLHVFSDALSGVASRRSSYGGIPAQASCHAVKHTTRTRHSRCKNKEIGEIEEDASPASTFRQRRNAAGVAAAQRRVHDATRQFDINASALALALASRIDARQCA